MDQQNTNIDYTQDLFASPETDRRMTNSSRQQAPANLRAIHHEIIRLTILGWKGSEIARYLKITPVTVSNCLASDKARNLLRLLTQKRSEQAVDLQKVMLENAPTVHDIWLNIITDDDTPSATRAKEAREYLGVCGFAKPQRIQSHSVHTHLTLEEIEQIKATARSRASSAGLLVAEPDQELSLMNSEGNSTIVDVECVETENTKCSGGRPH